MKNTPILTAFNGGELTPLLAGRVDVAKYAIGCARMEGFIPLVQGPAVSRPGTRFVNEVKTSAQRTWFLTFEFSADDAYVLEVGDQYFRFYTNRGQVITAPSTPYELATPYASADLTNSDGTFALRFVGTGDEVIIVHPSYAPQLLARHGPTSWTIAALAFTPPPFAPLNITTTTIYASAVTGSVSLTASASLFTAAHIGQYLYLGERDVRDVQQWEPSKGIGSIGTLRRSDGLNYKALNTGTTGSVKPTHTEGAAYDGDGGVQWLFMDPGYGWAQVTGVTGGTAATATVVSQLPFGCVTSGQATDRWAFQAWNSVDGWPTDVTFFRERLVFARGAQLWFSIPDDFFNFAYEIAAQITADSAFDRTIASDLVNDIRWLSPGDVLLVGTKGDEWMVAEENTQSAFGPTNCKASRQSGYGSNRVRPRKVGSDTVFVQKSNRRVRAMSFLADFNGNLNSPDVSAWASHVASSGIVDMAYQQEPWGILWCARADGVLAGLTLIREQDVIAWHRHPFPGGIVEAVASIPSPDGSRDDLWVMVRYVIAGVTRRYIAYLADPDTTGAETEGLDPSQWIYSDMAATYSGAATTTISGLGYLEGQTVWVLVDGARHADRVVSGGSITLNVAGSVVTVGLPSPGFLQPMEIEGGTPGTAQGKSKRAHEITFRVFRTCGAVAGPSEANLAEMRYRTPDMPLGQGVVPFTGDLFIEWDGDWDTTMPILVSKNRPQPVTVLAIMPQYVVSEGR